ncbi:MAG: hypothetical protein V7643_1860 [Mycobacterium sp.]
MGVRGRRCDARSTSGGCGGRIIDLARGSMRRQSKSAEVRGSLAIDRKRQGAPDRGTWTGVRGSFRLEQVQHPLGAIGSPMRDEATVV